MNLETITEHLMTIAAVSAVGSIFLVALGIEAWEMSVRTIKVLDAVRERKHRRVLELKEVELEMERAKMLNEHVIPVIPPEKQ